MWKTLRRRRTRPCWMTASRVRCGRSARVPASAGSRPRHLRRARESARRGDVRRRGAVDVGEHQHAFALVELLHQLERLGSTFCGRHAGDAQLQEQRRARAQDMRGGVDRLSPNVPCAMMRMPTLEATRGAALAARRCRILLRGLLRRGRSRRCNERKGGQWTASGRHALDRVHHHARDAESGLVVNLAHTVGLVTLISVR